MNQQSTSTSNYSHQTSHPAYQDNQQEKELQRGQILAAMKTLGGSACLKQLEQLLGLPQSTISGRMSDLRRERKVFDSGNMIVFENRQRKLFSVVTDIKNVTAAKPTTFFEN